MPRRRHSTQPVPRVPGSTHECALLAQGYQHVAGIDEAGRGCWAGPVVAAAVVFPAAVLTQPDKGAGINDSKALSPAQREASYAHIQTLATGVSVGVVPAALIDAFGILPATRLAMTIALLKLPCSVHALLIDAVTLDGLSLPQHAIIKGDAHCLSIAAASIVAKVTRDRMMQTAEQAYPGYGFAAHKGYGTAMHQAALRVRGPCLLHRKTFRPITQLLAPEAAILTPA